MLNVYTQAQAEALQAQLRGARADLHRGALELQERRAAAGRLAAKHAVLASRVRPSDEAQDAEPHSQVPAHKSTFNFKAEGVWVIRTLTGARMSWMANESPTTGQSHGDDFPGLIDAGKNDTVVAVIAATGLIPGATQAL